MAEGIVKWYNQRKGYGFIIDNLYPQDDIFIHFSNVKDYKKIKEGDKVFFDTEEGEKGKRAINADLIEEKWFKDGQADRRLQHFAKVSRFNI